MAKPVAFVAGPAMDILHDVGVSVELVGDPAQTWQTAALDSRQAGPGCLFVALKGGKADGHDFILDALGRGARTFLVESGAFRSKPAVVGEVRRQGGAALVVDSVLQSFQALARQKRLRHPGLVRVGITGSSGKTTTKEIVASILSRAGRVVMNPGNLNSDQGLALSLFGIVGDEDYGVFEMGMNRRDEMDELAWMYEPDFALITNVGTAHIGILGTKKAIAEEKKRIFSRFESREVGIVPAGSEFTELLKKGVHGEILEYGPTATKGYRGAEDLGLDGWAIDWEGLQIRFPLVGKHNLENAIAAITLTARMGIRAADVAAGLEAVKAPEDRSQVLRGPVTVVSDCYNSNPESAAAALSFCDDLAWKGRRWYVLGSMLELGTGAEAAHREFGALAAKSKAEGLLFFGKDSKAGFEGAKALGYKGLLVHEEDIEALAKTLRAKVKKGDLVLLKGSRGMALERLFALVPDLGGELR